MSATGKLTDFYGSFLWSCAKVSVSPYTMTLGAFLDPNEPKSEELLLGVAACVILSTVVPVLPTLTSITFAVAAFAACIALASMLVSYPVALICDALDNDETISVQHYSVA